MNVRFTAWFSEMERAAIDLEARRMNASANYVVRSAVRRYLKIDNDEQLSPLLHVTTATPKEAA